MKVVFRDSKNDYVATTYVDDASDYIKTLKEVKAVTFMDEYNVDYEYVDSTVAVDVGAEYSYVVVWVKKYE